MRARWCLNTYFRSASILVRLDGVVRLDAIPLLGTGKTDYKVLRKMVVERSAASAWGIKGSGVFV